MYDAVVVSARCSGSPTAMLLARKGYRVLLVDRAAFPSDSIRNPFIQHSGVAQLNRWGLLPRVITSNCPPIRDFATDLGDFPLRVPVEQGNGVDANYAPRRVVLDKILVDAAVAAGVELRERFTVHGLLWDDHRVVGIRGRANGGQMVSEHASIVIGADGVHSVVARAIEAPQYSERPALTYAYYSYFSDVPVDGVEIWLRSWGPTSISRRMMGSPASRFRRRLRASTPFVPTSRGISIRRWMPCPNWPSASAQAVGRSAGTARRTSRTSYASPWTGLGARR